MGDAVVLLSSHVERMASSTALHIKNVVDASGCGRFASSNASEHTAGRVDADVHLQKNDACWSLQTNALLPRQSGGVPPLKILFTSSFPSERDTFSSSDMIRLRALTKRLFHARPAAVESSLVIIWYTMTKLDEQQFSTSRSAL